MIFHPAKEGHDSKPVVAGNAQLAIGVCKNEVPFASTMPSLGNLLGYQMSRVPYQMQHESVQLLFCLYSLDTQMPKVSEPFRNWVFVH